MGLTAGGCFVVEQQNVSPPTVKIRHGPICLNLSSAVSPALEKLKTA